MFDVSREMGSSVALYCRKVLIQTKAADILPKWLRFLRGQDPPCGPASLYLNVFFTDNWCLCAGLSSVLSVCRCGGQWGHPSEFEQRAAAGERPHQVEHQSHNLVFFFFFNHCHRFLRHSSDPLMIYLSVVTSDFRKLRDVLQQRVIRFLLDQSKKEPEKYAKFFEDYGLFMREGIVTTQEQDVKVTHSLWFLREKMIKKCQRPVLRVIEEGCV